MSAARWRVQPVSFGRPYPRAWEVSNPTRKSATFSLRHPASRLSAETRRAQSSMSYAAPMAGALAAAAP
jgi:hypothetical protein